MSSLTQRVLLVAVPFLLGQTDAHMGISGIRAPDGSDHSFTSRSQQHLGDSFRYPNVPACHGVTQKSTVTTLTAGDTWYPKTSFGAAHGGGHCAWAVSTDGTNYYKFSDNKDCTLGPLGTTHPVIIPENLPVDCASSGCTISWFWTPLLSGSCEIYQNCFDIKVDRATGGIENDSSRRFQHGPGNMLTCSRVDPSTHWTTHYGPLLGASSPTSTPATPTPRPTFSEKIFSQAPTKRPTPSPTSSGAQNDECVSHGQLIAINSESSYWPRCDASQAVKGDVANLEKVYELGLYCSREYTNELNMMLKDLGYCGNREIIRNFIAQVAYETAYFTTLGQPIDNGAGIIHMIPANWGPNVGDMEVLFPNQGIKADFDSRDAAGQKRFFTEPKYAFKSAAAWFKRTNRVIPGCGKDLFPLNMDEQTKCILGRVNDRSEAKRLVSKHIPLTGVIPTNPPTNTPVAPTPKPTMRPTMKPTPQPTNQGGSGGSSSCTQAQWSSSQVYTGGNEAQYEGSLFRAKWWTQNNKPTSGGPWELVKGCDESKALVCGGVPTYSSGSAYGGGSLVNFNGKVYKAKWWVNSAPDKSDVWMFLKNCETVIESGAASFARLAEPDKQEGIKYRTFLEVSFSGLSYGNLLADDNLTLQQAQQEIANIKKKVIPEFTAALMKQYGKFIDADAIKGYEIKTSTENGKPAINVILELVYDSPQDAADAVAVLKQYESLIASTFMQVVHSVLPIRIESSKVLGNSGVVETQVDVDTDSNNTNGATSASAPSTFMFGALFLVTLLVK